MIPAWMRSLLVSLVTTIFDMTLFAVCVALWGSAGILLMFARWTCGALGAFSNFMLNRRLAFAGRRSPRQLRKYFVVAAGAVTLGTALWWLLYSWTAFDPRLLHLMSAAVVWLTFTYPLLDRWVFAAQR